MLAAFHKAYPEVGLDIMISDSITDIVVHGYDLGIRLGELLEEEVVALRLGGPLRQLAVDSPAYLTQYGTPTRPEDLHRHSCINWRQDGSPTLYRLGFREGWPAAQRMVKGTLTVNDRELAVAAAAQGSALRSGRSTACNACCFGQTRRFARSLVPRVPWLLCLRPRTAPLARLH